jgi:membrane protein implicated in regulation of membrane protease activity
MDAVTATFLAIGCFALLLLALSLVGGHFHLGHLHLGHVHIGAVHIGHAGGGGLRLTLPGLAGFVGMFGFAGAIAATLSDFTGTPEALLATVVGVAVGAPSAWAGNRLMDAATRINTDATPSSEDLVGTLGVVIRDVPAGGGYGEVRLTVAGQPMKFYARAAQPLAAGTSVLVIEVPSPTSVLVEPTPGALLAPPVKEGQ